jgi:DNA polymerase
MDDDIRAYLAFFKEMGVEYVSVEPFSQDSASLLYKERTDSSLSERAPADPAGQMTFHAPRSSTADPVSAMKQVREDLGDCVRCKLHRHRTNIVFGTGNLHAELMFVGEAPGADEDEQGIPFVGRAGQLLTKIIESIGLRREEVYIANVIKCRPPQNRNPETDEVGKCSPFLLRQIDVIQPRIICALGKFAAQVLLDTQAPISQLRGRFFDRLGVKIIPTFHPSYLLRNPAAKREVWEDMKAIRRMLDQSRKA